MKFVDLRSEFEQFKIPILKRITKVYNSGTYLFGEQLNEFETEFSNYIGMDYTVCVKNCTDAITMVVREMRKVYQNTIILPNFGAYPTACATKLVTDDIYYVDVDRTLTIDVDKLPDIKNGIVVAVNLFGNVCNFDKLKQYCKQNNNLLIEDCAQSIGSNSGYIGDISVFSFYPTKMLASNGDGGAICCNDENLAEKFKEIRFYGQKSGNIERLGINSRMDETQAAVLNSKLVDKFDSWEGMVSLRHDICNRYLKVVNGLEWREGCVFHQFPVMWKDRDRIIEEMKKEKIPFIIHYSQHVSEIEALRGKNSEVGYRVNDKIVSFPCHPFMLERDIQKVEEFLEKHKELEFCE